jgi:hypothetical protein
MTSPAWLRATTSRSGASDAMRHAQPTNKVSTATANTTASQMRM